MYRCDACDKSYSSLYNLKNHLKRQPLCQKWIDMHPGLKDYIDDKFMLPMNDLEKEIKNTKCFICNTDFANVGNLNRHLDNSIICSKWSMYKELEPLNGYIESAIHTTLSDCNDHTSAGGISIPYEEFIAPKYKLCPPGRLRAVRFAHIS